MLSFTTGDPVTFQLTIENDLDPSYLGTPTVVLSQDSRTFALEIVSVEGKVITCKLSREKSLLFVAGIPTYIQQSWNDGQGGILIFPEHEVEVIERFNEIIPDLSTDTDPPDEETPDIEITEDDYGDDGSQVVPYSPLDDDGDGYDIDPDIGGDDYDPAEDEEDDEEE